MKIKEFLGGTEAMIGLLVLVISSLAGGFLYLDERFALAADVVKLEQRVSLNELSALYKTALENLYFYRSQNRKYPDDEDLKTKLKESEGEVKDLKTLITTLKKKKLEPQ